MGQGCWNLGVEKIYNVKLNKSQNYDSFQHLQINYLRSILFKFDVIYRLPLKINFGIFESGFYRLMITLFDKNKFIFVEI